MELNLHILSQGVVVSLPDKKAKGLLSVAAATIMLIIGCSALVAHAQTKGVLQGGVVAPPASSLSKSSALPMTTLAMATPIRVNAVAITSCSENGAGKLLIVSIGQQHIWACDGTQTVNDSAVTTGANDMPQGVDDSTPTGIFHIRSKVTNTTLRGCDINGCWNDAVQYWMPFDGEVGFHDASWQTFPFGDSEYHTDGSHGCVHLPTSMAAWVYNWAPVGTEVVVAS